MKKKTLIITGSILAVIIITALILIFRRKPDSDDESEQSSNLTGSSTSSNAGALMLQEAGFPIQKGVSKRKEVYDMQVKLVNDYGANVGSSGPDGDWGTKTETAVLQYLKKNKFNSRGELIAAYGANPPSSSSSNPGWLTNVMNTVSNFLS